MERFCRSSISILQSRLSSARKIWHQRFQYIHCHEKDREKISVQAKSGWKAKEEGGIIAISMDKAKTKRTEQMTISVVKKCQVYPSCYLAKALISSDKNSVGLPVLVYGWNLNFPPHQSLTNTLSVIIIRK